METGRARGAMEFHTEDFDGPLDLLLALVAKNKMKIYEIEILTLIDQYLAVVGQPGPDKLDGASEFITMAAHLVQMKSSLLLPRSDEGERRTVTWQAPFIKPDREDDYKVTWSFFAQDKESA